MLTQRRYLSETATRVFGSRRTLRWWFGIVWICFWFSATSPVPAAQQAPRAPKTISGTVGNTDPVYTTTHAIQEQLGRKLESTKGRADRFVIESIERPTETVTATLPLSAQSTGRNTTRETASELEQLVNSVPSTEYEVAEIKRSLPETEKSLQFSPSGLHFYRGFTLHDLLSMSWAVNKDMISGEPRWAMSERFDISAKTPASVGAPSDNLKAAERTAQMLRRLLVERFKMAYHYEDVSTPVYALEASNRNTKLTASTGPADAPCRNRVDPPGIHTYDCHHIPMQMLASWLSNQASDYIDRPVIDFTDLTGAYDIHLRWATRRLADSGPNSTGVDGPDSNETRTIFQAMRDQLGLVMIRRRVPLAHVVIDHIEPLRE